MAQGEESNLLSNKESKYKITPSKELEEINKRTILFKDDKTSIHIFNYCTQEENPGATNTQEHVKEYFSEDFLHQIYQFKQYDILKHPFILNYINQILQDATWFYVMHFVFYFFGLILWGIWHINYFQQSLELSTIIFAGATTFWLILIFCLFLAHSVRYLNRWSRCGIFVFCTVFAGVVTIFGWVVYLSFENHPAAKILLLFILLICFFLILLVTPCGIYIYMLWIVLKMLLKMAAIWISLLLCLSIIVPYVMKNSSSAFWNETSRASASEWHFFTKTMAMLFGEVGVDEFIQENNLLTSTFILIFMVVTGLILLPLMIGAAVGEINELFKKSEDWLLLLKLKYNMVVIKKLEDKFYLGKINDINSIFNIIKELETNVKIDQVSIKFTYVDGKSGISSLEGEEDLVKINDEYLNAKFETIKTLVRTEHSNGERRDGVSVKVKVTYVDGKSGISSLEVEDYNKYYNSIEILKGLLKEIDQTFDLKLDTSCKNRCIRRCGLVMNLRKFYRFDEP